MFLEDESVRMSGCQSQMRKNKQIYRHWVALLRLSLLESRPRRQAEGCPPLPPGVPRSRPELNTTIASSVLSSRPRLGLFYAFTRLTFLASAAAVNGAQLPARSPHRKYFYIFGFLINRAIFHSKVPTTYSHWFCHHGPLKCGRHLKLKNLLDIYLCLLYLK